MRTDQQLIFLGGLHRSGTTPLARLLASHPDVSGLHGTGEREDEGQHVQSVYPAARAHGGVGRFANAAAAHLTEDSPLVSPDNARSLLEAWEPYWDMSRSHLLEKSPPNLIMTRFLQALFPQAAFVMVMRHPIVVALALQKWNPRLVTKNGRRHVSMRGMVAHWVRAYDLLREDSTHIRQLQLVRYEDLVADPEAELAGMQSKLGLSTPIPVEGLRSDRSRAYEDEWQAMLAGGAVNRRRRRSMEREFGSSIERYGYDVSDVTIRSSGWKPR